ncbi:methyltransferase domain-containing protein, partial [candidate division KSB1 bacterium]|nr:methyltransferase domain-containing protein [candidate division KSB1 bacterium]
MSLEFEKINCPLCGCEKNELFLKTQDRFNLNGELEFKIVACSECTFIFLNPRPKSESISAFYESENYQPFLSIQSGLNFWDRIYLTVRSFTLTNKRRKISKLKRGGRLLDIGCGTGEFLHEMQDHGWQVEGLEMDKKSAEFA